MAATRSVFVGIDTGGTYTDAVLFDDDEGQVLAKAKSPTTHDDLSVGIDRSLESVLDSGGVPASSIALVALSTTLATNALVEGRGRPACLVMIGFEPQALDRGGLREVIGADSVISVAGGHTSHGTALVELDLGALGAALDGIEHDVSGFAVTGQFAVRNPDHELAAREFIRDRTGLPVTCSHELSDGLNGPKRSVTALLNARLIPMIDELVSTTATILERRDVDAPLMVVRGNGSLVSAAFVRDRPVETILSGPAASLVGAAHLVGARDAIIADIGGTTTDIAVLRDGLPEIVSLGATVGGYRTMVEAVSMHTHGLGGDSEVGLAANGSDPRLVIGPRRVEPIVVSAAAGPTDAAEIDRALTRQRGTASAPGDWAAVFLRLSDRLDRARLDSTESALVDGIRSEPHGLVAADLVVSSSRQAAALGRLVVRGLVQMTAFTPTDASHVLGLQATHDPAPGVRAAELLARRSSRDGLPIAVGPVEFASGVVDALVRRSAEVVLAAAFERDGLPVASATSDVVAAAFDGSARTARLEAGLAVPLIAVGAPARTYYPAIAELLDADVRIPEHGDVANAVGAAVGRVRVRREVTVTAPRRGIFRVHAPGDLETVYDLVEARALATERGTTLVAAEMVVAGAPEFSVETFWVEKSAEVEGRDLFVEGTATVIASGRPNLD